MNNLDNKTLAELIEILNALNSMPNKSRVEKQYIKMIKELIKNK